MDGVNELGPVHCLPHAQTTINAKAHFNAPDEAPPDLGRGLRAPSNDAHSLHTLEGLLEGGEFVTSAANDVLLVSSERHVLLLKMLGVEIQVHGVHNLNCRPTGEWRMPEDTSVKVSLCCLE